MIFSIFSFIFFLSLQLTGPVLNDGDLYSIFSIGKINYVLTKDSIYSLEEGKGWNSKKHFFNLETYDLVELKDQEKTYLLSRGLGKVYLIENDSIYSIDNSFDWKSRFDAFNFIRNDIIHSYGGYGFYDFKNNIIYFDSILKEWSQIKQNSNSNLIHSSPVGYYDQEEDLLYVSLGDYDLKGENFINDKIFQFDFNTSSWKELKKINNKLFKYLQSVTTFGINNYSESAFINKNFFGELNFKKNNFKIYYIHNNNVETRRKIIYNEVNDEFFISHINNLKDKLHFTSIKKYNLLGENFEEYSLYSKNETYLIISAIILFCLVIFFIYLYRKRRINLYELIKNDKTLDLELNENELVLKNKLIEIYPKELTFPEISILLNLNLSYESNIKKTQKVILDLEFKIKKNLSIKSSIFNVTRNPFDKRIKQVRIN